MKPDPNSVFDEPWMNDKAESSTEKKSNDPHAVPDDYSTPETAADGQSPIERILHSVHSEPQQPHTDGETELSALIDERRAGISPIVLTSIVILSGLLAGPVSILGTFAAGGRDFFGIFYLVAGGPVIEEMLKLGGLLYLLEKKPWYIMKGWQIVLSACLSALLFGVIENLVYGGIYLARLSDIHRASIMDFRWTVTIVLHIGATFIGALGLRKAWLATIAKGRLFDSAIAEPYIAVAVIVHGLYNAAGLVLNHYFD